MNYLWIDVETTGLDFEKDRITEIGLVVWDTEKRAPLHLYNVNLKWNDAPELSDEIVALTGIDQAHLDEFAEKNNYDVLAPIFRLMQKYDGVVAHNAPFDRGMLETAFRLAGGGELPELFWIDTSVSEV